MVRLPARFKVSAEGFIRYGASPREALAWTRRECVLVVRGNHDRAVCGQDPMEDFNPAAQAAVYWTRAQLEAEEIDWLAGLEAGPVLRGGAEFAHGSPTDEDEYLVAAGDAEIVFETCGECGQKQSVPSRWHTAFTCGKCGARCELPRRRMYSSSTKALGVEGFGYTYPRV